MTDEKTVVIDGITYEEYGPYCEICGAHMGELYNPKASKGKHIINPHNYVLFGDNTCPECGQKYYYMEDGVPKLSDEVKAFILICNMKDKKVAGVYYG